MLYFLGPIASYSHQAAINYLSNSSQNYPTPISISPLFSIANIFTTLDNQPTDYGIVPIENSTAGDVIDTFAHLFSLKYWVSGEIILPIQHILAAKNKIDISKISKVYSHTQALSQCSQLLQTMDAEQILTNSTSQAAKLLATTTEPNVACICSPMAATEYGLEAIKSDIANQKDNFTRFFVVNKLHPDIQNTSQTSQANKLNHLGTCKYIAVFTVKDTVGSLVDVLIELKNLQANMTKLESRPIQDKPWQYKFYVEFVAKQKFDLSGLKDHTDQFNLIGMFEC